MGVNVTETGIDSIAFISIFFFGLKIVLSCIAIAILLLFFIYVSLFFLDFLGKFFGYLLNFKNKFKKPRKIVWNGKEYDAYYEGNIIQYERGLALSRELADKVKKNEN